MLHYLLTYLLTVVQHALEVLGFGKEDYVIIFQLVAAILKLGNIQFQHKSNMDGTDGCKILNTEGSYFLSRVCYYCYSILISHLVKNFSVFNR